MALISATRNFGSNGLSLAALQEIARNLPLRLAFNVMGKQMTQPNGQLYALIIKFN